MLSFVGFELLFPETVTLLLGKVESGTRSPNLLAGLRL
jgi:hypothetical protein